MLASLLSEAGYRTAAFVSGFPLAAEFGLAKGFDLYDDAFGFDASGSERAERKANETTNRALDFLAQLDPAGRPPLFLWVHYYDAHEPYAPPEPFRPQGSGLERESNRDVTSCSSS